MKYFLLLIFLFPLTSFAQIQKMTLEEVSTKINKDLPEVFDPVTKLLKTTVENNNLIYNFIVNANQTEFDWALPKVKTQIMNNVCSKPRERWSLKDMKANLVYRYENTKGQFLGEFMVRPDHCLK